MQTLQYQPPLTHTAPGRARFTWLALLSLVLTAFAVVQLVRASRQYNYGIARGSTWFAKTFKRDSHDAFEGWTSRRGAYERSTRAAVAAAAGAAAAVAFAILNRAGHRHVPRVGLLLLALLVLIDLAACATVVRFWSIHPVPAPFWD